jgi:hypothetical protein
MRDGVRVPALGEHGDADDALDVLAELSRLADGVHDFAEQVFVGEVLDVAAGEALAVFGFEFLDFAGGDFLEIVAHGLARFELPAIDEDCIGAMEPAAARVVVAEDRQLAGLGDLVFADLFFPAGDPFENHF